MIYCLADLVNNYTNQILQQIDNIYESKINTMKLKIYSNKTNQIIFEKTIDQDILKEYDIDVTSDDFTELFETEILSDIFEILWDVLNIPSSMTYYELK